MMTIAELRHDYAYRSLMVAESTETDHEYLYGTLPRLFTYDTPIGANWRPLHVAYAITEPCSDPESCEYGLPPAEPPEEDLPCGDFPSLGCILVFTKRAFDVLHSLISPFVEFLPLQSNEGEFVAFKVLRFVDALDCNKSDIEWFPRLKSDPPDEPRVARQIRKYVFHDAKVANEIIFRLPQSPLSNGKVFVTERFIQTVRDYGLKGFRFTQVWPPIDLRQKFLEKRLRKRRKR